MNIMEDVINSTSPENLPVHVPLSDYNNLGVSSFDSNHFIVVDGRVKINPSYLDNNANLQYEKLKLQVSNSDGGKWLRLLKGTVVLSEVFIKMQRRI